ncbi:MAG TPA: hypothetical protein VFX96_11540 [Pyrinomonadaceae bacterium]|nr:hypothetical protein [Pyrinomonadaceae bacterium]
MTLICRIVTDWVEKEVIEPVDKWVDELRKQCEQYPWWDPRGLVCWFIVVSVRVTSYITKTVTMPVNKLVCYAISVVTSYALMPIGWLIDEIAQTTNVQGTILTWLRSCSEAVLTDKLPATKGGVYNYFYTCECCDDFTHEISFLAEDDKEAYKYARKRCAEECANPS